MCVCIGDVLGLWCRVVWCRGVADISAFIREPGEHDVPVHEVVNTHHATHACMYATNAACIHVT